MKASLHTMKPNIMRKTFWSPLLNMRIRAWISMKARKNIMKQGSFDKYILNSRPEVIDSKFGQYLRQLMEAKKKNPDMIMPYIPRSKSVRNNKKTKYWQHSEKPAIYLPYNLHMKEDLT